MDFKSKTEKETYMLSQAWLGLEDSDFDDVKNLLIGRSEEDIENPQMELVRLLRKPENFYLTCKYLLGIELLPLQCLILEELWHRPFSLLIASRGFSKSYLLAILGILKCLFIPGTKIVIVGAAFRQSKVVYEYMETIWNNAPILRDICGQRSGPTRDVDRCTMKIGDSWAVALPLGTGEKIRGLRANLIMAEEFNCLDKNTLVETDQGLIRIGDIDELKKDMLLNTGDDNYPLEKPSKIIKTALTDVYKITLDNGYVIKCSENHQVMTNTGWKKTLDLTDKDYIECENSYIFPTKDVDGIDASTAWLMGILVSEGWVNDEHNMSVSTTNFNLANKMKNEFGFKIYAKPEYERKPFINKPAWKCKKAYNLCKRDTKLRDKLYNLGLDYTTALNKKIPWSILQCSRAIIISFLSGLFEGDGTCFVYKDGKWGQRLGTAYYSSSETLARDVHILLLKLGYDGFIVSRISDLSPNPNYIVRYNGLDAFNLAKELKIERFDIAISKNEIQFKHPTFISFDKSRNKFCTQFRYLGKIIQKRFNTEQQAEEYIKEKLKDKEYKKIKTIEKLPEQDILYDYHLPKTHSFYAGGFRQHNSIPVHIYETVVSGFSVVSQSPIKNVKDEAVKKKLKEINKWTKEHESLYQSEKKANQQILSGTCGFEYEPFADYWKKYKTIIESKGDPQKLTSIFPNGMPNNLSHLDFSIIRLPYDMVPEGFLDGKQIARAKASVHSGVFSAEYCAVFPKDSDGFFRRSLIDSCVGTDIKPVQIPNGDKVYFDVLMRGQPKKRYVIACDPASEHDNFSITVLELYSDHRRVVYAWSSNKKDFNERLKTGLIKENDFYSFCCRKIRDLMKIFPCERIGMDSQGGGIGIREALHDPEKLQEGESLIWPVINPDKEEDTDTKAGLHILEMVNFANGDWNVEAHNGLRKDCEDHALIFPRFDPVSLALAAEEDEIAIRAGNVRRKYDSLEDATFEIEEMKYEMSTIVQTKTPSAARDRFDSPEIKLANGRKGRMRKDRFSSLVIANMLARQLQRADAPLDYSLYGGNLRTMKPKKGGKNDKMYQGIDWLSSATDSCFLGVKRDY